MTTLELVIIALGLAMDAFAVSICKGLSVSKLKARHSLITGSWFGIFQAVMPLIGYLLGVQFERYITNIDHWIAFVLLGIIGVNMIREALSGEEEEVCDSFSARSMFPLAIATSIDALAVGITFACLGVPITIAVILIGTVTFALSAAGVKIGNIFGAKFKTPAEIAGGATLIILGSKILLEHLGIL